MRRKKGAQYWKIRCPFWQGVQIVAEINKYDLIALNDIDTVIVRSGFSGTGTPAVNFSSSLEAAIFGFFRIKPRKIWGLANFISFENRIFT